MCKRSLQRTDRFVNQRSSVVKRNDCHFGDRSVCKRLLRQSCVHLFDLLLHVVDHLKWVGPMACHHHATHGFHPFFVETTPPGSRPQGDECQILNLYRNTISYGNHCFFQVGYLFYVTKSANKVFRFVDFNRFGAISRLLFCMAFITSIIVRL